MATGTGLGDQVIQALRQSPIPELRGLRVEEAGDALVLSGRVHSYYLKQMAQETVLPLLNGRELNNRVLVRRRDR